MIKRFFFLIVLIFTSHQNLAAQGTTIDKDPHHQGLLSTVNLGFRFSSVLENRGVILYDGLQMDPIAAFFFLDDRVEFLGDSIGLEILWQENGCA